MGPKPRSTNISVTDSSRSDGSSKNSSTINNNNITHQHQRGPNVLILSSAGKPIFVRYGSINKDDREGDPNEDEWSTACGIIQGLRANVLSFGLDGLHRGASCLGDIQSIQAGKRLIVFKNTDALTLVAISDREDGNHNEAWLHLQLEYVYSQVIFTLTAQVQSIFLKNPSYDLRSMMGSNVNSSIRNLLDRFDPVDLDDEFVGGGVSRPQDLTASNNNNNHLHNNMSGCGSFLTSGVECVHPIPPEIRDTASKMLIHACGESGSNDLFAMLVVGTRLVTIIQPPNPLSQLHTSDLHLILTFVGRQPGLLTNELWFPLCLPRFDSSGFLYAYTSCLDPVHTGLSIVLVSPDNNTEQFESFRHAANTVRKNLGLKDAKKTKVLRVFGSSNNASATSSFTSRRSHGSHGDMSGISGSSGDTERDKTSLDVAAWAKAKDDSYDEEDTDDPDKVASRISARRRPTFDRGLSTTDYLDAFLEDDDLDEMGDDTIHEAPLLTAVKVALSPKQQEEMMNSYLQLASAVHFVFRCDIYVNSSESNNIGVGAPTQGAMLTQCFGPPLSFPFVDASSQSHVWDVYQRLSLRLRLGSSTVEKTMDAFDNITDTKQHDSVGKECPMQCLLESPPNTHSVTYLQEDNEWLYVGLNGKYFELYAILPATIPPKNATAKCARLVRKLMGDERILFLSNPLTWGSN